MDLLSRLFHTLFPLTQDKLQVFVTDVGSTTFHVVLFAIIFCETGLVVTPFLPGDSLLFAVGAVGAHPESPYSVVGVGVLLVLAALLGDNVNYWLGRKLGPAVFSAEDDVLIASPVDPAAVRYEPVQPKRSLKSRLLNKKHLKKTQSFYEKYGAKTVIMARFVPIVRTFAPFVAGVGQMNYFRFLAFSLVGAIAWVSICLAAGYSLGQVSFVKKHFEIVVLAIIVISVLPIAIEYLRHRSAQKRDGVMSSGR